MKIQKFFLTIFAATALLFGCEPKEEPAPALPLLTVGQTDLSFEQAGGTATVTVTSNRAWSISTDADWLAFSPNGGAASDAPVSVTVTALANSSNDRTSSFKVKTDFDYKTVNVSQKGQKGEDPNTTPTGKGTADDPYNVVAAINAVANLTYTDKDNYQATDVVYVKGKIFKIEDNGTFTGGGSYGNASFHISTDGSTVNDFYAYRILYLGNKKFKTGQTDIKVGDEVVICGKLMNYNGKTPETVSGAAYLYSLNGETAGGQGSESEPKGTGTLEDPYNPAGAAAAVAGLTWTSNDDYQSTDNVYVKGKICRIADNGTFTEGGTYGNASFFISEDGEGDGEFQIYRALYLGNKKFESGQTDIKVGDEVIICGKLMNYRGNTPETVSGKAYVYSLNGVTGGGDEPGPTGDPKGTGTLEDPYNPAAAAAAVKDLTWTSNTEYQTTDEVYVKGKICKIANKGTFTESGTYGNASFFISEDGTGEGEFQVYRTLYLGNRKFAEGDTDIKVGDEVVILGKLMNYQGKTPETDANNSHLYSLNGVTDGGDVPGPDPGPAGDPKGTGTLDDPYNPAGAAAAVKDLTWTSNTEYESTDEVYVKGKICKIAEKGTFTDGGTYGNATFFISEDGTGEGEFQVYRTLYLGNKKFEEGQTDIKVGDEVIICGKLMNYKGNTPETVSGKAYVYSLNGVTGGGGDDPGPVDPEGKGTLDNPYSPAEAAAAVKDLTWTSNTEYQTTGEVYVKGKICKIANKGTFTEGGTYGNASFSLSADGTGEGEFQVYRTLYLGNKKYVEGQTDIRVGDEVIICGKLMNYKGNTPETDANNSYLYSLNGVTDGGGVPGPGGDDPGPGPGGDDEIKTVTVAEFLAAADSKTQAYKLTGKVSNIKNTTYGNFDLTDDSGTIYVYGLVSKDLGGYEPNYKNDKSFASIGIKEGDTITIVGYRETFTKDGVSTNEATGSYYVSGASGAGGGGESGGGDTSEEGTITWASADSWKSASDGAELSYTSGNITITAKKDKASNKPAVNASANDCRVYAKGSLTITTTGDAMTSIVFNISKQGLNRLTSITANTGTIAKQAKGDKTVKWTGSAKSVTFTVGEKAIYGSDGETKAGQFDFSSVVIK